MSVDVLGCGHQNPAGAHCKRVMPIWAIPRQPGCSDGWPRGGELRPRPPECWAAGFCCHVNADGAAEVKASGASGRAIAPAFRGLSAMLDYELKAPAICCVFSRTVRISPASVPTFRLASPRRAVALPRSMSTLVGREVPRILC